MHQPNLVLMHELNEYFGLLDVHDVSISHWLRLLEDDKFFEEGHKKHIHMRKPGQESENLKELQAVKFLLQIQG